jgi:hypothetical protein
MLRGTMSFVSEEEKELILDLVIRRRMSSEEFMTRFPLETADVESAGIPLLQRALQERDSDAVEYGLLLMFRFGVTTNYIELLTQLAEEKWHISHENIISALDRLIKKERPVRLISPAAIDLFYRTALSKHDYLDFDEAFALAVKCVWALGNIGTMDAVRRLGELLHCGNPIIEENALQQLDRAANESALPEVRSEAVRLLDGRKPPQEDLE